MNEILLYLAFCNQWLMNELAEAEELAEMLLEDNMRLNDELSELLVENKR